MPSLREMSLGQYMDEVSSSSPTPGGGSVAAVVAALATCLGAMVAALAANKATDDRIGALAGRAAQAQERFLQLSAEDQSAFEAVMAALRLDKDDPNRAAQIKATIQVAADTPLAIAQACHDVLIDLESLAERASRHSISDVGAAAHLALAALRAALLNVAINVTFMADQDTAEAYQAASMRLESDATVRAERIVDQVFARIRG